MSKFVLKAANAKKTCPSPIVPKSKRGRYAWLFLVLFLFRTDIQVFAQQPNPSLVLANYSSTNPRINGADDTIAVEKASYEKWMKEAKSAIMAKQWATATVFYEAALKKKPKDEQASKGLDDCKSKLALTSKSKRITELGTYAELKSNRQDFETAMLLYRQILAIDPKHSQATKGIQSIEQANRELAKKKQLESLRKNADELYASGDFSNAMPVYKKIFELNENDFFAKDRAEECENILLQSHLTGKKTETMGITLVNSQSAKPRLEPAMLNIEGGTFLMGDDADNSPTNPVHKVKVDAFLLMETEVTQEMWEAVMGKNPSQNNTCKECPVENVSWEDVQEFIKRLNQQTGKKYRLPTEAEWEFAARGGNQSQGFAFSGSKSISEVAWCTENSNNHTHPVKQLKPNELGLYDMCGNVNEWCSDFYDKSFPVQSLTTNPVGPKQGTGRVYRGGSCYSGALYATVAYRYYNLPSFRYPLLGFRLAHSL